MNTPQTWSESPIHEQIRDAGLDPVNRTTNDTPTYAMLADMRDRALFAERELITVTKQRDSLIKAIEPLEYWRDISECDCSNPLPQGGCLRCDLERILKLTNPNEP